MGQFLAEMGKWKAIFHVIFTKLMGVELRTVFLGQKWGMPHLKNKGMPSSKGTRRVQGAEHWLVCD